VTDTSLGALERAELRKVSRRLIPFLMLLYVVAWLDRVNVGFAALQMNEALGFSAAVYGFGAGVFFVGYALFEVPSNLALARFGARRWIARIMITWGVLSTAMMFVVDATSFYALRFLLGVAEAGFFPGIVYYLGLWYPRAERARAVSLFMTAIPLTVVIGGPIAGVLLRLDGVLGLGGWQWLFLLEGLPAVILGFVVLSYLEDGPHEAAWLTAEERESLVACMRAEHEETAQRHGFGVGRALLHPLVWQFGLISFAFLATTNGLTFWLPQILQGLSGLSDTIVATISAIPYAAAAIAMVLIGWNSDRTGERFMHAALPLLVAALGFAASAYLTSPVPSLVALSVAAVGELGGRGPYWALPTRFLAGSAAAGGIALINTFGAVGGFVGPYFIGIVKDFTGGYAGGLQFLALLLLASAILILGFRRHPLLAGEKGTG
jgi:ACS family tartrate transporter-like MFS transporter